MLRPSGFRLRKMNSLCYPVRLVLSYAKRLNSRYGSVIIRHSGGGCGECSGTHTHAHLTRPHCSGFTVCM